MNFWLYRCEFFLLRFIMYTLYILCLSVFPVCLMFMGHTYRLIQNKWWWSCHKYYAIVKSHYLCYINLRSYACSMGHCKQSVSFKHKNIAVHSEPHPTPHSRVLPPGEFNNTIPESLPIFSESFMTIASQFSRNIAMKQTMVTNIVTNKHTQQTQYLTCCGLVR